MKIFCFFILLNIACIYRMQGQSFRSGGGPQSHLNASISPREIGMGNQGVVTADGVFAWSWNPAMRKKRNGLYSSHAVGFAGKLDINSQYRGMGLTTDYRNHFDIAYLFNTSSYQFGAAFSDRSVADVYRTRLNEYTNEIDILDTSGVYQYSLTGTFGVANLLNSGLSTGFNVRLGYSDLDLSTGSGIYEFQGFDWGFRGSLVGSPDEAAELTWGTAFVLLRDTRNQDLTIKAGIAYRYEITQLAFEAVTGTFQTSKYHVGIESGLSIGGMLTVMGRAGIVVGLSTEKTEQSMYADIITFGAGLQFSNWVEIDFSYIVPWYSGSDGIHRLLVESPAQVSVVITPKF